MSGPTVRPRPGGAARPIKAPAAIQQLAGVDLDAQVEALTQLLDPPDQR